MGIQWSTESTNMMKSVICAVLIAAVYADAEPKADADAYLGYTGLTQGVHGVNGVRGLAGLGYAAPYGYAASPYAYGTLPYGYGFHGIGKRSADADAAYRGAYNGYASPFNYGYGYNPITYGY